jgi:PII-like signaling protein
MARIYLMEGDHRLQDLLDLLHHQHRVSGVTVFRGIAGFGASGKLHRVGLLEASLNLPLVVEFFDRPQRVLEVVAELAELVEPEHIVTWDAQQYRKE